MQPPFSKLVVATTNPGKAAEIRSALSEWPVEFLSLRDVQLKTNQEPAETANSYQGNALIKAKFYFDNLTDELPVLAEDSGIVVNALAGELGVHTRRWGAGAQATDQKWIDYFLKRMLEFPHEHQRQAAFVSCAVLYSPNHFPKPLTAQGQTEGVITPGLEAPLVSGVPLSSCFRPHGCNQVYSALSETTKNQLSHRGKALKQLITSLKNA